MRVSCMSLENEGGECCGRDEDGGTGSSVSSRAKKGSSGWLWRKWLKSAKK